MAFAFSRRLLPLVLLSLSVLFRLSVAQDNCNTKANPYCDGDDRFASICCPSPSVCYFKDRLGTPGCCGAGQICINAESNPPPTIPNGAVSLVSGLGQITACIRIMSTNSLAFEYPAASFSVLAGLLAGAARPVDQMNEAGPILLPVGLMVWQML